MVLLNGFFLFKCDPSMRLAITARVPKDLNVHFCIFLLFLGLFFVSPLRVNLIVFSESDVKFGPYSTKIVFYPIFCFHAVFSLTVICILSGLVEQLFDHSTLVRTISCHPSHVLPFHHPLCTRQNLQPPAYGLTPSDEFAISRLVVLQSSRVQSFSCNPVTLATKL